MSASDLPAFAQSTLVSAVENLETARELLTTALPFCLKDALENLVAAEGKVRNLLAIIEEQRRLEAMEEWRRREAGLETADTEPPR